MLGIHAGLEWGVQSCEGNRALHRNRMVGPRGSSPRTAGAQQVEPVVPRCPKGWFHSSARVLLMKSRMKKTYYGIGTSLSWEFSASHSNVTSVVAVFNACLYRRKISSLRLIFLVLNSSAEIGLRICSPPMKRLSVGVTGEEREWSEIATVASRLGARGLVYRAPKTCGEGEGRAMCKPNKKKTLIIPNVSINSRKARVSTTKLSKRLS